MASSIIESLSLHRGKLQEGASQQNEGKDLKNIHDSSSFSVHVASAGPTLDWRKKGGVSLDG